MKDADQYGRGIVDSKIYPSSSIQGRTVRTESHKLAPKIKQQCFGVTYRDKNSNKHAHTIIMNAWTLYKTQGIGFIPLTFLRRETMNTEQKLTTLDQH